MVKVGFTNQRVFTAEIGKFAETLPEAHLLPFQKAIIGELANGAIFGTPVREGFARGGWKLGHGNPVTGDPHQADTTGALALAVVNLELLNVRPFEVSYLGNDVVYILKLEEDGHSKQNRGWVKATVEAVNAKFP